MVSAVSMKHVCVRYLAVGLGPYSICLQICLLIIWAGQRKGEKIRGRGPCRFPNGITKTSPNVH